MRELNAYSKILYRRYINGIENDIKINPKRFWSYIKSKKSQSEFPNTFQYKFKSASTPAEAANLFAEFFQSNYLASSEDASMLSDNDIAPVLNCGYLIISNDDVLGGIHKLNSTLKVVLDGFCSYFLKFCSHALSHPLSYIFNLSLKTGIFLDCWKLTLVDPIFKKGNKCDITNYRPISKLSNISKLFEIIIKSKITFCIENFISPRQHGFVRGRSTVTNLVAFTNFCYNSFNANSQVDVVYTDFSKAFDQVSHDLLIAKLSSFGFHSSMLNWFKSYLHERKCMVVVDGFRSIPFISSSGVPQGSILGPLLFIIFINDIGDCFHYSDYLLYADDLKIFKMINNFNDCRLLQADIDRLSTWCVTNKLSLNVSKCSHLTFSRKISSLSTIYSIDNCILTNMSQITDLGVVFDSRLTFNQHINYIVPKAYVALSFIRRHAKKFNDLYTLKSLYSSLVRSRLEYAVIVWNPTYSIHIQRLERIQNVFTKIALRSTRFSGGIPDKFSRNLLIGLNTLEQRRILLSALFLYDIISGSVHCSTLLDNISFFVPPRTLRHSNIFYVPTPRSQHASKEPILRAMTYVNSMSNNSNIDFCVSKSQFKSLILNILNTRI